MTHGSEELQIAYDALGAGGWILPSAVVADRGMLRWESAYSSSSDTTPSDLIDSFVGLRDADDEAIAAFAFRHGLLFNRPDRRGHRRGCRACELAAVHSAGTIDLPIFRELLPHGAEPIDAWRRLAGDLVGALRVAAAYHQDEPVSDVALASFRNVVIGRFGHGADPDFVRARVPSKAASLIDPPVLIDMAMKSCSAAHAVGQFTDVLLDVVRLRTRLTPDGLPSTRIEPGGLLGALGLQLAQKISKTNGLALCSGCSGFFSPKRKPSAGRRTYCGECRDAKIPERDAARSSRAKSSGQR
jgi:hypothetical protein